MALKHLADELQAAYDDERAVLERMAIIKNKVVKMLGYDEAESFLRVFEEMRRDRRTPMTFEEWLANNPYEKWAEKREAKASPTF